MNAAEMTDFATLVKTDEKKAVEAKEHPERRCASNGHSAGWYVGYQCQYCGDID